MNELLFQNKHKIKPNPKQETKHFGLNRLVDSSMEWIFEYFKVRKRKTASFL